MARSTSGSRPGTFVAALTAVALAVVGWFAYQAAASPDRPRAAAPAESPSGTGEADETDLGEKDEPGGEDPGAEPVLPADSGEGARIVYSLTQQRVWLVDAAEDGLGEEILRTYPVHPSTVLPEPGEYAVTSTAEQITGSDGVPVEHVVVFASVDGVVIGFSASLDGSLPDPDSTERTGGIRQSREDGAAMWELAGAGFPVVVVP
ncbi:hypothetical protein GCM10009716_31320 [Streptomyces sodiiphilus]|uniref:L,D-transpeptidase n=1 Tax=Streptomyces sodiiphilus TaxID=226217 RepID=A0ABN2PIT0_9ACTN